VLAGAGAIAVESTAELADVLAVATALAGRGPARPAGTGPGLGDGLGAGLGAGRTMVLTDGGGDSVMAIDALAAAGLSLARPSAATRAELDTITPPGAPRTPERNPVTLDTAGGVEDDPALLGRCARIAAADDSVDVIVVGGLFGGYPRIAQAQVDGAAELVALHRSGKPVLVQSAFALARSEPVAALRQGGVPVFATMDRLARALGKVAGEPGTRAGLRPAPQAARPQPGSPAVLPVEQTARLLDEHGVELPELLIVRTEAELPAAAAAAAYPACLKIADPAVAHKSDVGGVVLGLPDAAALRAAAAALWLRFPGSPLLVMPSLPGGLELLVGAATDPVFGPFVLVGRGGIWAETDPDVAMVMAPADDGQARAALESLRCAPMLSGGRGTEPVDVAAIARLIAAMSHVAVANPDLAVEANPVIAYREGYAVADLRASRPA
jgi:acetate---CoA ligase (ADP-forming)